MSRIGKAPIQIPSGVELSVRDGEVKVKKDKTELVRNFPAEIVKIEVGEGKATVSVNNPEDKQERSLWGTWRKHVENMVVGVTEGFNKNLEIDGVGYQATVQGTTLVVKAGYSHEVKLEIPVGVGVKVDGNVITVSGADIESVGAFAAKIKQIRPVEPYKGKGIRYQGEYVIRKEGKAAKAAGGE